jgi:hypothetical protein
LAKSFLGIQATIYADGKKIVAFFMTEAPSIC